MVDEYLLVDGYNVIYSWKELEALAMEDLSYARDKLLDILCNYQGFCNNIVIVVFDAYKVKGTKRGITKYNNIYVVYTKELETADQYIEKTVNKLYKNYKVRVATSDALEQIIIIGKGAIRISSRELEQEILSLEKSIRNEYINNKPIKDNMIKNNISPKANEIIEKLRRS